MTSRRKTILILEDTPARIERFKRIMQSQLPLARLEIVNTASAMVALIKNQLSESFAVSLDHDLYVSGVDEPGDGLQIATHLSSLPPSCPVIIHTSNSVKSSEMQGVLESESWEVRLAGAIGENWIESDWITEVTAAYNKVNA